MCGWIYLRMDMCKKQFKGNEYKWKNEREQIKIV